MAAPWPLLRNAYWPVQNPGNGMKGYEALALVADLFERKPGSYNFQVTSMPRDEDTPGCILGHVGRLMGMNAMHADHIAIPAFSMGISDFFEAVIRRIPDRARILVEHKNDNLLVASAVVPALRALASELKAQAQAIPQQVLKIFAAQSVQVEFIEEKQEVTT